MFTARFWRQCYVKQAWMRVIFWAVTFMGSGGSFLAMHFVASIELTRQLQKLTRSFLLSWNPRVCYFHKSPPLDPVLSQLRPVCTFVLYFCRNYFNTFSTVPPCCKTEMEDSKRNILGSCHIFQFFHTYCEKKLQIQKRPRQCPSGPSTGYTYCAFEWHL
jgi:hypothetical protein